MEPFSFEALTWYQLICDCSHLHKQNEKSTNNTNSSNISSGKLVLLMQKYTPIHLVEMILRLLMRRMVKHVL